MRLPRRESELFACTPLHAVIPARLCILRQRACAGHRTRDTWRGQAAPFPTCADCPLGRAVRRAVRGAARPAPPGPRLRPDWAEQLAARRAYWLAGLLDRVPSLDEPPDTDEPPDEGQGEERATW